MTSHVYFPLRANASSLLAGSPANGVRRRMKIAALLYDHLIVDDGSWHGVSGPEGSMPWRFPPGALEGGPEGFQTAMQRSRAGRSNFWYRIAPTGSTGPGFTLRSPTTINWRATFEPIKKELAAPLPWLDFVVVDVLPEHKPIIRAMVRQDVHDGLLQRTIGDQFSRKLIIESAAHSLVLGSAMGSTVSVDQMHARVLQARIDRGDAAPVFGARAVEVLFPDVMRLSWKDLDAARVLPGLPDLRQVLAEIETTARAGLSAEDALDAAIQDQYRYRLESAVERFRPSVHGAVVPTVIGSVIGMLTIGSAELGLVTGASFSIADAHYATRAYSRSWTAAGDLLTRRRKPDVGAGA